MNTTYSATRDTIGQVVDRNRGTKAITTALPTETTAATLPEAQTTPTTTSPETGDRKIAASAQEIVTNPPTEEDPATHHTRSSRRKPIHLQ